MGLRLRLLGGARLEVDGEPVRGRAAHRRRLALLALLALAHPRGMTRERIVAYLWPENDSDGARRLLSEALYVIRKELGEDIIASVGDELCLNAGACASDVAEFRQAIAEGDHARAVGLYTGALLDGWYVAGAPDFDEWAERERAHLAAA
jgi:DNA-binding SARP family transcriptional activator